MTTELAPSEPSTAFSLPEDGWFHIATPGEWPHKPTGLVQILDDEAMAEIVKAFVEFKAAPNWPGVLIDFDHQSLDQDKPTTAAGWIVDLEQRPTGLWARVRWSDLGRKSIEGGRYRFISPVWKSSDCALLGQDRIRPLKLMNCAVTNDPNIKGLFPLSNSVTAPVEFSPPAMPIENRRPLTDEQRKAIHAKNGGRGRNTVSGDPSAAYMRDNAPPHTPVPMGPGVLSNPTNAYMSSTGPRELITPSQRARESAAKAGQLQEIQAFRSAMLRRAYEQSLAAVAKPDNPSPAPAQPNLEQRKIVPTEPIRNSIRLGLKAAEEMSEQQRRWWFASMGGQGSSGTPRATRDHDMRISAYNQQIAELEASRRPRPELFAPDGIRNWRETRDRLMRQGASPSEILSAIAADKAHNKNVRDYLRAQKRSIRRRYKDKGAQERALERERRKEINDHEKDIRAWQREDDKISREIRRLEGRRDEEIAKASDSELRAQRQDAAEGAKNQRATMAAFSRAYSEYQRTERERARVQGRQELAEWRANEVMRRQAASEAERQAREEMRRNDPVTLARQEAQRVREFNNAVLRGDWTTATQLNTGGNLSALRQSMSEIARDVGPRDRDRAAKLLTSELDRYHQTVYGEQHWGA